MESRINHNPKQRERIGVGVIGVGKMGRRHSLHLANRIVGANLVALADIDANRFQHRWEA